MPFFSVPENSCPQEKIQYSTMHPTHTPSHAYSTLGMHTDGVYRHGAGSGLEHARARSCRLGWISGSTLACMLLVRLACLPHVVAVLGLDVGQAFCCFVLFLHSDGTAAACGGGNMIIAASLCWRRVRCTRTVLLA